MANKKKPDDEWVPPSAVPADDDWMPPSARVPVSGHSRSPRRANSPMGSTPIIVTLPGGQTVNLDRGAVADALPTIGGAAGSALGKPIGAIAGVPTAGLGALPGAYAAGAVGAGLGGGVGELGAQLLMGERPDLGRIGSQAVGQAAFDVGGRGLGQAAKGISKPIMQLALRASPEVAATAIREGISATKLGLRKLMNRMGVYANETTHIVSQATRYGQRLDMLPVLQNAYGDVFPKVTPNLNDDQLRVLKKTVRDFVSDNPNRVMSPKKLHILKQRADAAAAKIYALQNKAESTNLQDAEALFYKSFADRARETLNATVQGYEQSNAPTEALIKLKEALVPVQRKEMSAAAQVASAFAKPGVRAAIGASVGAALPGDRGQNAMIGAGVGAVGASPQALSALALSLDSPLIQMLLRQSPRAVGALAPRRE